MVSVGIVGATGYTGFELMRLLAAHPEAELAVATSNSSKGRAVGDIFPGLRSFGGRRFEPHDSPRLKACDLVLFATPNATAMRYAPDLLESGCRVIDLSADFRIRDIAVWERWYQATHACPCLVKEAVYGLPELNREQIKTARLIANPGCYPTATVLALLPALQRGLIDPRGIIVDAKSGVSGAGRKAAPATQFAEVAESFRAYNASGHRHLPEMTQALNGIRPGAHVELTFIPHLLPMNRGLFVTAYVRPLERAVELQTHYTEFYADEPFVEVMPPGSHPETRMVRAANYCQMALHPARPESGPAVILCVIDNLVKGAAGQALQNMNLMFGLDESLGLAGSALLP